MNTIQIEVSGDFVKYLLAVLSNFDSIYLELIRNAVSVCVWVWVHPVFEHLPLSVFSCETEWVWLLFIYLFVRLSLSYMDGV